MPWRSFPPWTGGASANGTGASVVAGPGGNTILATVNGQPNRVISGVSGASPLSALNLPVGSSIVGANVAGATLGGGNGLVTAGVLGAAPGQGSLATASVLPGSARWSCGKRHHRAARHDRKRCQRDGREHHGWQSRLGRRRGAFDGAFGGVGRDCSRAPWQRSAGFGGPTGGRRGSEWRRHRQRHGGERDDRPARA